MKEKKNSKSLEKWLFSLSVAGTAIMSAVIILISMFLFMRSVRKIYKNDLRKNSAEAVQLAGEERITSLCRSFKEGQILPGTDIDAVSAAFRQICEQEGLKDIELYAFDEDAETGYLLAQAYPQTEDTLSAAAVNDAEEDNDADADEADGADADEDNDADADEDNNADADEADDADETDAADADEADGADDSEEDNDADDDNGTIEFERNELDSMFDKDSYVEIRTDRDGSLVNSIYTDIRDQSGNITGLLRLSMPVNETLEARIQFLVIYMPVSVALIVLFAVCLTYAMKKRVVLPLEKLRDAAASYSSRDADALTDTGEVYFTVPEDIEKDEIGTLWNIFSDMEASIKQSIRDLKTVTAEKEREAAEIRFASQIQEGMLPGEDPEIMDNSRFRLCGSMTPARGIGGDFYDYFLIDDDHLALVIGDVTGKGIPSALFMMMSMTHIRTRAASAFSPARILTAANKEICANNPKTMFVTVWMGILEISTGIFRECNAGHECPAVLRDTGAYELYVTEHDVPLGIDADLEFHEFKRTLKPGERIFVYSDGVPEAADQSEEQFGFDRMLEVLNRDPWMEDRELLESVKDAVYAFADTAPGSDDLTMLSFTFL
ncbi:MAG: SpoIIE family protein phosphatase [Lachnospiraceae bacterium]|nr:SpoIIE family protein phosphatase [Lachnospiraceae bacterium]